MQNNEDIEIFKLYAYLEILAKPEELKLSQLDEIENYFATFKNNKKNMDYIMERIKDKDFIQRGEITKEEILKTGVKGITEIKMNGDSLLLRAMSLKRGTRLRKKTLENIIKKLIEDFPDLISLEKFHEESKGVTPVHLAIVQGDKNILQKMADNIGNASCCAAEQETKYAIGDNFQGTVMMAGTLLGIASLMCNEEIFQIIFYNFGTKMDDTNEKGDNIIHSLIKHAHIQPEKLESVLDMLKYILNYNFIRKDSGERESKPKSEVTDMDNEGKYRMQVGKLLMMKNREKLTPLQLASKRQQYRMFENIIKHEVYLSKETNGGVFYENQYDITELETLAMASDVKGAHNENIKSEHHESVLEYVVHHETKNAFLFTNVTPVKGLIKEKWQHYSHWFFSWFVVYFFFMIFLSVAAFYRSQMHKPMQRNDTAKYEYLAQICLIITWHIAGSSSYICAILSFVRLILNRLPIYHDFTHKLRKINLFKCVQILKFAREYESAFV